ncbi:MAG: hypothetical protein GX153_00955, partial [Clostridiaceae bacterium]|nr:hypothetical protein [Clostridiaceae bacterium]
MKKYGSMNLASRFLSIVLLIVLVLGVLPVGVRAADAYPTDTRYEDVEALRVSVCSDLHLTEVAANRSWFARYLRAVKDDYDPQLLIMCGDPLTSSYSDPGDTEYDGAFTGVVFSNVYEEVRAVVNHYLGDDSEFPIILTSGNHDSDPGDSYYANYSGFSSYYGVVPTEYFDIFMFGAAPGAYQVFSDAQIAALDAYLNGRSDKSRPVYVTSHFPIDANRGRDASNAQAVKDVLAKYDQPATFLWGHDHNETYAFDLAVLIKEYATYTTANAGSNYYRGTQSYCQGLYLTLDPAEDTLKYTVVHIDASESITRLEMTQELEIKDNAQAPVITLQPAGQTVGIGDPVTLSVGATVDRGILSYQWYANAIANPAEGTLISGATEAAYAVPTDTLGTVYYYCEVTNTDDLAQDDKVTMRASQTARVSVIDSEAGWDGTVATGYTGGSGTAMDPYLISSGAELAYLAQQVSEGIDYADAHFLQTADIRLNNLPWTPIGEYLGYNSSDNKPFSGTYDGDGHIIYDMQVNVAVGSTSDINKNAALFAYMDGSVKNLGLVDVDVSASSDIGNAYAGGIAGYLGSAEETPGSIVNCFVTGIVDAGITTTEENTRTMAGGIAANLNYGTITNCYAAVTADISHVTSEPSSMSGAGGVIGYRSNGSCENCYWNTELTLSGGVQSSEVLAGVTGMTGAEMQTPAFVAQLTANAGAGKAWMADPGGLNAGYPIHERAIPTEDAEKPVFLAQPADQSILAGTTATLNVDAHVDRGLLTYQWFWSAINSNQNGVMIPGATQAAYPVPTGAVGSICYYYCVVTNTDEEAAGATTASAVTRAARIDVTASTVPWDGSIATVFAGGSGTEEEPYLISNGAELAYLAQQVNAGTAFSNTFFRQTEDIDLDGREWTPIGRYIGSSNSGNKLFSGTYDGDGYTISNLNIDIRIESSTDANKNGALFAYIDGVVQNLGLIGAQSAVSNSSGNAYAGGIAGYLGTSTKMGHIKNSYVRGSVSATITYSSSSACVMAGGIAAHLNNGSLVNCYAAVTATISYASSVSSRKGAGGLIGYLSDGSLEDSHWNTEMTTIAGTDGDTSILDGTNGKTQAQMQEVAFATELNAQAGALKSWISDPASLNGGYPIHLRTVETTHAQIPVIDTQPTDQSIAIGGAAT